MQTIDIRFMRPGEAARALVSAAPARGDYWGVTMRAKYASTRPADVVEQYRRTVRERAWSYFARLPRHQKNSLRCDDCGATGCKLWRESHCYSGKIPVLCASCVMRKDGKTRTLDADGKWYDEECGKCDQIGWFVPAVPDVEGVGFWGYTSVPADGVEWWRTLPTYPR